MVGVSLLRLGSPLGFGHVTAPVAASADDATRILGVQGSLSNVRNYRAIARTLIGKSLQEASTGRYQAMPAD